MGWVHLPNLASSLATEAFRLVCASPAYRCKPSATSNSTPTAKTSWSRECATGSWMMRHCGMMFEPLTGNPGVDTWICLLEDSRANPTPWRASAEEKLTNAISGQTPLESFGKWDPDSCCWRTYQASLLTGMQEPWSGNWPKSGMTACGTAYRLWPSVPRTSVGGGGALPTPDANRSSYAGNGYGQNLRQMAKTGAWPTPKAHEHMDRNVRGNLTLNGAAKLWPTPQSHDQGMGDPTRVGRFGTKHGDRNLNDEVLMWPTPTARDRRSFNGAVPPPHHRGSDCLVTQVGGQLNPRWVEWLMGLPIGWVSSEPLATESYRQWWRSFCG